MNSNNDRRGQQGEPLLPRTPVTEKRKDAGSLRAFPGAIVRDETPAERHARARARRASRSIDPPDALDEPARVALVAAALPEMQSERAPITEAADEISLIEKLLRRRKPAAGAEVKTTEPVAATLQPSAGFDEKIGRVEAMLLQQQAEMARLAGDVSAATASSRREIADAPARQTVAHASPPTAPDDDGWKPLIDPARVVRGVLDSRGLIVALTVLGAGIGVLTAVSTPKKYEATAEIVIDPRDLKIGDRPLTDVNGLPSDSTIALVENQVRVLSSGTVLNKVAEELNLESDPEFNGAGGVDLNPINLIRGLLTRSDGATDPGRLRAVTVSNLGEQVSVERTGRSFVVEVHATADDGETAANIANRMVSVFMQTSGDMQSNSAGRANAEVVAQLDRLRRDVEAAEQKVEKYRADNDLVNAQGRLISDDEILKLNDQLGAARARTLELNARADSARNMSVDAVIGGAIPEVAASGMITELRSQYSAARQEADRTAVRLGPRHPTYQSAQAQVAAVSQQISTELKRISAQIQSDLRRSVQTEQELAARLAQLKVRQGSVSTDMVALRELERDAQAKRSVYEAYLLRASETGEQKAINSSNVSIISNASPPIRASGTSRVVIAGTGAMLGAIAGLGLGILRGIIGSLRETAGNDLVGGPVQSGQPAPRRSTLRARFARKREDETPEPGIPAGVPTDKEDPVNPLYPPQNYAPHPPQPVAPVQQPAYAQPHPYAQPVAYPQAPAQQPLQHQPLPVYPPQAPAYPYPPQAYAQPPYPPQAYPQAWQPAPPMPQSAYPQPYVQPYTAPYAPPAVQPSVQDQAADSLSQISESVREFRDAVRELAETRLRRRYF